MQGTTAERLGAPAGTWAPERERSCGAVVQLAEDRPGGDGAGCTGGLTSGSCTRSSQGTWATGGCPRACSRGGGGQEPFGYTPGPPVWQKACPRPQRFTRAGPTTRTEPATRAAVGYMWVRERLTPAHPSPPCGGREPPTAGPSKAPMWGKGTPDSGLSKAPIWGKGIPDSIPVPAPHKGEHSTPPILAPCEGDRNPNSCPSQPPLSIQPGPPKWEEM